MQQFVRELVTSGVDAGLFSLIAAGLVLTYSTTRIFNLGYAGIAFASAYLYFELNTGLGWPQWAAALVTVFVMCPLLGLVLDVAIFRRLTHASEAAQIVATVGILLALPALCSYLVTGGISDFGWKVPSGTTVVQTAGVGPQPPKVFHLFSGVVITSDQITVLATAVVCIVGLFVFLRFTLTGLRMRGVADRQDLAAMRGVNDAMTSHLAWVLGTVLTGVAGIVGAPILHSLDPGVYITAVFVAIAAAVVGRFRSVLLALVGAIAVALISNLVLTYATFANNVPGFNDSVPFIFLLGGLLVLANVRGRTAGSITAEPPPPDYRRDLPRWRRNLPSAILATVTVVWLFAVLDQYWLGLATQGLILGLVLLSITIITGTGGMVSLAQSAFVAGAGLFLGVLVTRYGVPWVPALVCTVVASVLIGILVALPSLRLGGVALALATLALALISSDLLFQLRWLSNGQLGWTIPQPHWGPIDLGDTKTMAIVVLILMALTVLLIRNLQNSTTGRQMIGVRNAPAAAASIGISPAVTRLKLFALASGIAGLGGVLYATSQVSVTSASVSPLDGLLYLAAVVLLGVRRPIGAITAGFLITMFPALINNGFTLPFNLASWSGTQSTQIPTILFGMGAITLARQPDGIFQGWSKRNFERRQKRRQRIIGVASPDVVNSPVSVGLGSSVRG